MNILIVAATQFEILPFLKHLDTTFTRKSFFEYTNEKHSIKTLVTGVGSMLSALGVCRLKGIEETNLIINAGVAGSFVPNLEPGKVVEVTRDRFADLGVEEANGEFTDVHELELINPNLFPFKDGWIENEARTDLTSCSAVTVNKVSGSQASIDAIKKKYGADLETMEGAGFLYAGRILDINCTQIRAISNFVEPRNRDHWKLELAIDNLNQYLISYIDGL